MNRTQDVRELMESMHVMQQKIIGKKTIKADIAHITFSQLRVLELVHRKSYATVKEIHTALGVSSSAVTQLVNELVKKRYVVRRVNSHDRRASTIILSPKTSATINKIMYHNIAKMEKLFRALNDKEFKTYINLHKKLIHSTK